MCHTQLDFGSLFNLDILADFEGGDITSDAGGLLFKEIDSRYGGMEVVNRCLDDSREPGKIKHTLLDLIRQRIYQIALSYEDQKDADALWCDPTLKTMVDRKPQSGSDLGSQPTLSRFENGRTWEEFYLLCYALVSLYIQVHLGPRRSIVLDMDGTDDPAHGQQEFTFFTATTGNTCITRFSFLMALPVFPWPRCFVPATSTRDIARWQFLSVWSGV